MKHKIFTHIDEKYVFDNSSDKFIEDAIISTLQHETVDVVCVINVLISDNDGIRSYNKEYRGIDKVTDVLSFPMQVFTKPGWSGCTDPELDEDSGELPLGDIVISMERVEKQAVEYGNKVEYETAYLLIHSMLHLLGYDHDDEIDEKVMHSKTENILSSMSF